ncbi:MAG: L-Ala-D/L-Glu epimerase [Ewingella americana]|uniref:L-Ala-D/L-Glu epimerase n=1 Tax=Ewingella americana TaxID=41202 RepID=UPI00242B5F65|nr:L-Ala-D/L-Glu epimerase [Ewingella americana]MCI1678402.1 L-Ala-D/L-Glu epimerase [Ewingella americana]MCI1853989.1 L-Ala-D/L-Glu epimerase [Ewingella americana]MCI1861289.1 L-Ala-D/L-Glu epimerase [Ewingella americana]MCI2144421.1 L-Ala-D/L-Glu epimerase [Ewingella americana]MCI2166319.1 L-Ala-D/L-Glu epimerase [Ewingella americana]
MRSVRFYPEAWPLHTAFVISRGSRTEARVVTVEIEQNGVRGVGECTPYPRYGESETSVMEQIASVLPAIEQGASRDELQRLLPAGAARNALDCALWNLESQLTGRSLWELTGVEPLSSISMAQTLSVDTPEAMAAAALTHQKNGATLLKVKLDDRMIAERMVAIRSAVPHATLIVDANESWQSEGLAARCQLLADLGVMMLEQPLPAGQDSALENFIHPLPICADESCHTLEGLEALQGRYEMVNIKLDKTGGLTEALRLASGAHAQGFDIMLGCMLCTSRAVRAALPLAAGAKFVDLDGPTWLAQDVEPPLAFHCGVIDLAASKQ